VSGRVLPRFALLRALQKTLAIAASHRSTSFSFTSTSAHPPRQILKHLSDGRISRNEPCLGMLGLPADFAASPANEPSDGVYIASSRRLRNASSSATSAPSGGQDIQCFSPPNLMPSVLGLRISRTIVESHWRRLWGLGQTSARRKVFISPSKSEPRE
jgi:hypothetical protein